MCEAERTTVVYPCIQSTWASAIGCRMAAKERRGSWDIEWCATFGNCRRTRRPRGDDDAYLAINPAASRWAWADTSPVKAPACGATPSHTPSDSRPGAPTRETLVTLADLERE